MSDCDLGLTPAGLRYTMHRPTVTTRVSLLWPVPAPASTSWTSAAAAPCTTPPPPTPTESKPRPFSTCWDVVQSGHRGWGQTALHPPPPSSLCVSRCVEYLLRNNADPGVRDKQGYNAVHYASAYGCTLCLELVRHHRCILGNAVQCSAQWWLFYRCNDVNTLSLSLSLFSCRWRARLHSMW